MIQKVLNIGIVSYQYYKKRSLAIARGALWQDNIVVRQAPDSVAE